MIIVNEIQLRNKIRSYIRGLKSIKDVEWSTCPEENENLAVRASTMPDISWLYKRTWTNSLGKVLEIKNIDTGYLMNILEMIKQRAEPAKMSVEYVLISRYNRLGTMSKVELYTILGELENLELEAHIWIKQSEIYKTIIRELDLRRAFFVKNLSEEIEAPEVSPSSKSTAGIMLNMFPQKDKRYNF